VVVKPLLFGNTVGVHSKDSYGQTMLSLAALYGHEAVVKLLLWPDTVVADRTRWW